MSEEVKIDAKRVQAITNTGQAYDDVDPLVEAARNHAIKECRRYNFLVNSQNKYDYSILKGLFNKMGGGKLHRTQLHVRIRPEHFAGEQCLH